MRIFRAVLPFLICTTPALALDLPARKAGLWEMKLTMEGRNLPAQSFQHCVDAATDKQMGAFGNARADQCSKQDVQRSGDTITIDSVCNVGAGSATSHAVVTGSFDSAYTVKVNSKREGGPAIPGRPPETSMTIEAKWLGACKADQKPGDIVMANGRTMNIIDAQKRMGGVKK